MRGGTFRFGGIFGGINKKQNHNIPVNTLPVGYGSIPSLAPLLSFRWCNDHLKHPKNPPSAGFLLPSIYPSRTGVAHHHPSTQYPPRAAYLSKNTNNGLSFSRPLNIGARCSTGVPFNCSVSLRATITQDGRGSESN